MYIVLALFLLRMLWNASMPYFLARQYKHWQQHGGKKPSGVSLFPVIELTLLFVAIVITLLTDESQRLFGIGELVLGACLATIVSYVLMIYVGRFLRSKIVPEDH
jgi:hypothetical protein